MEQAQQMLNFYHNGFLVCMALAILSFALAVFMFFRFKILNNFKSRTGLAVKTEMKKHPVQNPTTGRIRRHSIARGELTPPSGLATPPVQQQPSPQTVLLAPPPVQDPNATVVLGSASVAGTVPAPFVIETDITFTSTDEVI